MGQLPAKRGQSGGALSTRTDNPIERPRRDFESVFGRMWGGLMSPFDTDLEPMRLWDFDVKEDDKEIAVRAELPGFEEKELDVQLNNDVLTIKAEKEQKGEGREEYRSFFRSITLPSGVDAEKAQASYRNGVLELHIPRTESARPRRIPVHGEGTAESKTQPPLAHQADAGEQRSRTKPKAEHTSAQGQKEQTR